MRMAQVQEPAASPGMVRIDGAHGEGGGQVIRSSLTLSMVTGRPFRAERVRANRSPAGLRPQHLMAVRAAARVCDADVSGAEVGSDAFEFVPGAVTPGEYEFDIGTAGSTTLVLQTILLPLLMADAPSTVVIEGGTHNTHAPPVEFLAESFLPLLNRIGGHVELRLVRYGTYPRGGGRIDVTIEPTRVPERLELVEPVTPSVARVRALVLGLPTSIAERELAVVAEHLDVPERQLHVVQSDASVSTGNAVIVSVDAGPACETISAIGQRGLPAEDVAMAAVHETTQFLECCVPVGEHLADQLLLPLAVLGGGSFLTVPPSRHFTTNVDTIGRFLTTEIRFEPGDDGAVRVDVQSPGDDADAAITAHDISACGMRHERMAAAALEAARQAAAHRGRTRALADLVTVLDRPEENHDHPEYGDLAREMGRHREALACRFDAAGDTVRDHRDFASWCHDVEDGAAEQMRNAMRVPSAVAGALMPDAHRGYGLPIGGVLATEGTVIPYAVGVDIACRMRLSVLDADVELLERDRERLLEKALLQRTKFGAGGELGVRDRRDHPALERARWDRLELTRGLRDRAWAQLGTSGSGNHFVEFGLLVLSEPELGLPAGSWLALLSHSGSRGPGAQVAQHFTRRAQSLHPDLPPELRHLAWLDLDDDDGRAYWEAMELMGDFAAASHEVIHSRVLAHVGAEAIAVVENHHNFAWRERHGERDLVVHRKGATPAGPGVLGVIPGSMASPAFVVRGRGEPRSLRSAAHGAGRVMSRSAAKQRFNWQEITPLLRANHVKLLSAGIDENPLVYKDIHHVMAQQRDLVDVVARFEPRVVRMDSR